MPDLPLAIRLLIEAAVSLAAQNSLDALERSSASSPALTSTDEWLTPEEASRRLGVGVRWMSRRWRTLPFAHPLPGGARGFRVNARELAQEMAKRR